MASLGDKIVLLGSYASLPGNQDIRHLRLVARYVIQIRPSISSQVFHSVFVNMCINIQCAENYYYVQIILVCLHPQQQGFDMSK